MRRHYDDELEVEERAKAINAKFKHGPGPQPQRKIIPCTRCMGQALLDKIDNEWVYCCITCGEEFPLEEN